MFYEVAWDPNLGFRLFVWRIEGVQLASTSTPAITNSRVSELLLYCSILVCLKTLILGFQPSSGARSIGELDYRKTIASAFWARALLNYTTDFANLRRQST
jgi:hypothetical protein